MTAGQAAGCDAAAGEAAQLAVAGLETCSFTASWLATWSPAGGSAAGDPAAARLTAGRAAKVGHLDSGVECSVLFSRILDFPFSWVFLCISSPRFGPITVFLVLYIIFHFQSLFIKEDVVP